MATFKYDLPGRPVASNVDIDLYFGFYGDQYLCTLPTNEEGVVIFEGLIVGDYSLDTELWVNPPVPVTITEYDITGVDIGYILLAPICFLIYRKMEGKKRRIILMRVKILRLIHVSRVQNQRESH
ncbi:MAG: hypothetical protein ACFE96_15420 [Candidatus Hermodarchaeota archaeon]